MWLCVRGKRRALDKLEQTKAHIRAKVTYPFHMLKNLFRHLKARYRGLAKNTVQLFMLFGLANPGLAHRRLSYSAQGGC